MSDKPLLDTQKQRDQIDAIIDEAELHLQETHQNTKIAFSNDLKQTLRNAIAEGTKSSGNVPLNQRELAMQIAFQTEVQFPQPQKRSFLDRMPWNATKTPTIPVLSVDQKN